MLNVQERNMKKSISSDVTNPEMLADQTFKNIIDGIQNSNLNFQLQVSPFSAFISLKKSLVKDKSGSYLQPPSQAAAPTLPSQDLANLLLRIKELESDLLIERNNHCDVLNKYKDESVKLVKENKALKQENKSLSAKLEARAFEINQQKATVADLNKDKNVLSVALKSAKQDLKNQSKMSEKKLGNYEIKLTELSEFKAKKLEEERRDRLRKKKELRREARKSRSNNNIPKKDTLEAVIEENSDQNSAQDVNEPDLSVEYGNGNSAVAIDTVSGETSEEIDSRALEVTPPTIENKITGNNEKVPEASKQLIFNHSEPNSARMDENAPVTMKSLTDYFDSKFDCFQNNDLEEKEEGFVGPRLPSCVGQAPWR